MMRQLAILWIGCLGLWVLLGGSAWLLLGDIALLDASVACALCIVPMTATLVWCEWAFGAERRIRAPEQQLLAMLGGTGVRMFVVLVGGIVLFHAVNELHRPAFLLWVVVFYLTTLTLEVALMIRRQEASVPAENHAGRSTSPQPLTDGSGPGR
jgi:hypothetical protein